VTFPASFENECFFIYQVGYYLHDGLRRVTFGALFDVGSSFAVIINGHQ